MMAPRRSSGCGACIPELTTRRHRGRLLCLGSRAKASTLWGRHIRFAGGSVFHTPFCGLLSLLATQQKLYNHSQQEVQGLIPHNYYIHQIQHIRRCTQQTVCSTNTHTHPYCDWNVCLHTTTVQQSVLCLSTVVFIWILGQYIDIVHRSRKRLLLSLTVNGSRRVCWERCQVIVIIGCLLILVQVHPPQYS